MDARTGVIVLCCLIGFTCEKMLNFESCIPPSGKVSSVHVVPCNTEPCRLHRGRSYVVSVTFTSAVKSRTSKAVVHGVQFRLLLPWPISQEDGCRSGIHCPVQKKKTYTYVGLLTVKPEFPLITLDVQWVLRDDHDNHLFCIFFPIRIVD